MGDGRGVRSAWKALGCIAAALALHACSQADDDNETAPAVENVTASPAPDAAGEQRQAARADPADGIALAAEEAAAKSPLPKVAPGATYEMGGFCMGRLEYPAELPVVDGNYDVAGGAQQAAAQRAIDAAILRRDLITLGYPAEVVKPLLDQWARDAATEAGLPEEEQAKRSEAALQGTTRDAFNHNDIGFGGGVAEVRLIKALRAWRDAHPGVPDVSYSAGECGAGEEPMRFMMEPRGRLYLIPAFYATACEKGGIDPFDLKRCRPWTEIPMGSSVELSGDYAFLAVFDDGRTKRGRGVRLDGQEEGEPPIVVRP